MNIFPTLKFQIARIKLKILTHSLKKFFCMFFFRLEGSQQQNLPLSDPTFKSKWKNFTVYINSYSKKYISTRFQYTSTAFSTYAVEDNH